MAINPKNVTIRGRLSFPRFTHVEAMASAGKFEPQSSFNLLLEQGQVDKLVAHIRDEYIPYVVARNASGEKSDSHFDQATAKKVLDFLEAGDWSDQPPWMPLKVINPKYADATPECVARVELKGPKGGDIKLKARVEDESQLAIGGNEPAAYPALVDLSETKFEMYAGAYVAATINLYSFFQTKAIYGIGAGASVAVYLGNLEGEPLGGGTTVDEDSIFED